MATAELEALLRGEGWPVPERGCDLDPPEPPEPARLRKNTCYVVLAVLLNDKREVLVMQEAKRECRGTWYLPAGRMEPRESIVEAVQREVKEETGLQCRPLTLLAVEERGAAWIRFVFLAQPTGGTLKTLQEADAESLQARWWNREAPRLLLRAQDIIPLMELALQYQGSHQHPPTLPAELPCAWICQRLLLVCVGRSGTLWALLGTAGGPHLPVAASATSTSGLGNRILSAVQGLLQERVLESPVSIGFQGLLGLQHLGKEPGQSDGVCFNMVATIGDRGQWPDDTPPALQSKDLFWWKVEDERLRSMLLQRLHASSFIPIL